MCLSSLRLAYVSSCDSDNILRGREQKLQALLSPGLRWHSSYFHCILLVKTSHKASLEFAGNVSNTDVYNKSNCLLNREYGVQFNNFI